MRCQKLGALVGCEVWNLESIVVDTRKRVCSHLVICLSQRSLNKLHEIYLSRILIQILSSGTVVPHLKTCCGSWKHSSHSYTTSIGRKRCSPSISVTDSSSCRPRWSRPHRKGIQCCLNYRNTICHYFVHCWIQRLTLERNFNLYRYHVWFCNAHCNTHFRVHSDISVITEQPYNEGLMI